METGQQVTERKPADPSREGPARLVLALASLGPALWISQALAGGSFSILTHGFRFNPFLLVPAAAVCFGLLLWDWQKTASRLGGRTALWGYLPLGLGGLSPLLARHFITASDLRARIIVLGAVMLVGFLGLRISLIRRGTSRDHAPAGWSERFSRFSPRTRVLILFLAAFVVYNLAALSLVRRGLAFSGDEPYYLLTSHSFYQDQDMNLANNYENNDFRQFYPRELFPKLRIGVYARPGRKGWSTIWPINQPGISALILPQYALSRLFKGRTLIFVLKSSLALWGALLGVQIYLLALQLWKRERLALTLWLFFGMTTPVLFYSIHVYPEIAIALFSVYIFRMATVPRRLSRPHLAGLGVLLGTFFWFGLKYNMVFWPLLLICAYYFLKRHRMGWKVASFLAPALLLAALFYLYVYELYGTFNPIAVYEGVVSSRTLEAYRDIMLKTPLSLRIGSFFDYFLDQRDGLLLYAPIYLFALAGLVEAYRRHRKELIALLFITAPFVLNYAFFAHRQGHSPQARVLANLTWVFAILIGYFLAYNRKRLYSVLFWSCGAVSLALTLLLLKQPQALYQPTTHEFTFRGGALFVSLSNLNLYLPDFLPSFLKVNNWGWIPNYFWLALILVFTVGYIRTPRDRPRRRFRATAIIVTGVLLLLCLGGTLFPRMALLFPRRADYPSGHRVGFYGLDRHIKMPNPGEFRLTKDPEFYEFNFTSWRQMEELHFHLGSETGAYRVELMLFDLPLFKGIIQGEERRITYTAPPHYPYKRTHLYRVTLRLEGISGTDTAEHPFAFSILPEERSPHPKRP